MEDWNYRSNYCHKAKRSRGISIYFRRKGSVEVGGFAVNEMKTWNFSDYESGDEKVIDEYSVNPPNVYGFGHQSYYEHVVDCIKNNTTQLVDGYEGRKSLKLIIAIYESIESGKEVFLNSLPNLSKLEKMNKPQIIKSSIKNIHCGKE